MLQKGVRYCTLYDFQYPAGNRCNTHDGATQDLQSRGELKMQGLCKAVDATVIIPMRKGRKSTAVEWSESGFRCSWTRGKGLDVLSMYSDNIPMPFHAVVNGLALARTKAVEFATALLAGDCPEQGVFRRVDLPVEKVRSHAT